MGKANPLIASLNAGEFSPKMRARSDFSRYPAGAEVLLNMLIDERGGIFRRPGTYYTGEVKDSAAASRLVDVIVDEDNAYMIEMADNVFRFNKDQGPLTVSSVATAIANGTFAANVTSWTDKDTGAGASAHSSFFGSGSMVLNSGGTGATDIAWRQQTVTVALADQSTLHVLLFEVGDLQNDFVYVRVGTSDGGAELIDDIKCYTGRHAIEFTPGTGTIYVQFLTKFQGNEPAYVDNVSFHAAGQLELISPYDTTILEEVRWAGTANVCYFVQGDTPVYVLVRRGDYSWSLQKVFFGDGPYLDANTDATHTITPFATTGLDIAFTANKPLFKTTFRGRLLRIRVSGLWGYVLLHTFTSPTVMNGTILRTLGGTSAYSDWALGAWCEDEGYPQQVELFKQRGIYAATEGQPQTVWGTQVADIENMMPDSEVGGTPTSQIEDDDAFTYKILEKKANRVNGLVVARDLIAMTVGTEVPFTSSGPALTPTDVDATPDTSYGSSGVDPHAINSVVVFAQRGGRRVLRLGYDIRLEGYGAEDLTILSEHITKSGIRRMVHAQEPNSIIFCVLNNGTLAAMTFHPEQQVAGWTRVEIGGKFQGRRAVVEDAAVIPGSVAEGEEDRDELWLIVKRTINGSTKRYIEILDKNWQIGDAIEPCVYSDSALLTDMWNQDSAKTLTLSGPADADDDDLWVAGTSMTLEADGHTPFLSGDVGDVWRLRYEGELLDVEITAFTDTDTVTVTVLQDVPDDFRETTIDEWLDPGAKVSSVSGLSHLEGQSVIALVDGNVQGPFTVTAGAITLDAAGGCIVVGLQYEHRYKSLKIDAGAILGTAIGKKKTIGDVMIDIYASAAVHIGPTFSKTHENQTETITREGYDPIGHPDKLWKGEYRISFKGPWGTDERLCIQGDQPLPCWILGLAPELEINETL